MRVDDARRVLARAAVQAGGVPQLAQQLKIGERVLRHYIEGHEPVPDSLYLMVVDVLMKNLPDRPD